MQHAATIVERCGTRGESAFESHVFSRVRGYVLIGAKHEYIMIAKGHVVDHTFGSN